MQIAYHLNLVTPASNKCLLFPRQGEEFTELCFSCGVCWLTTITIMHYPTLCWYLKEDCCQFFFKSGALECEKGIKCSETFNHDPAAHWSILLLFNLWYFCQSEGSSADNCRQIVMFISVGKKPGSLFSLHAPSNQQRVLKCSVGEAMVWMLVNTDTYFLSEY